jgi:putative ABC transport system permease protein
MSRRTLGRIGWRYLIRHPWQSVLMVLGITLGVAVVVAVDLANASASRAFDLSTSAVAGKATHQITGGPQGLDEDIYTDLRRAGLGIPLAPVLVEYVSSPQLGDQPFQMIGVDPFAEAPFRSYLGGDYGGDPTGVAGRSAIDLTAFLTQPGAILMSQDVADRYSLAAGQPITLEVSGRTKSAFVAGVIQGGEALNRQALAGLVLVDIATAQELTGRLGKLDRIDVILPAENPEAVTAFGGHLPEGAQLESVAARSGTIEQMTEAFRVNLTALSLLALVVGMFLIYNTITFSVVQRRPLFGTLRCLGVTRQEVFLMVMSEALLTGLLGGLLGVGLGLLMGQGAVRLVTQTINDLFFVVTVRGVQIQPLSLLKGALLGVSATLLTAAPPAWEAAAVPPRQALSRSGLESKARRAIHLAAAGGLGLILIGLGLLLVPTRSLVLSFLATFTVIVGCALLVPAATGFIMRWPGRLLGQVWGSLGRMAPRDVLNSLSRTAIAIMALMVAVSVTIGVSLMVSSFRKTVETWLGETLQGDIYISAPSLTASTPSTPLERSAVEQARAWPGVARSYVLRSVNVGSPYGPVHVAATDNDQIGDERVFLSIDIPVTELWEQMQAGAVIVSEPFANRLGLPSQGGSITLDTLDGPQKFPVLGIYYDYASTQGTVLMALPVYQTLWRDRTLTAMAIKLSPGSDVEVITRQLQDGLAPIQRLLVRANRTLLNEVLEVFDRTFAITSALQLLAMVVAFIGVLSALLSLELERQRELGILRAVGLTVRQLWGLVLLETGLMGGAAGLLSMPTGYVLALILVYIINRRSFGWTLQMQVSAQPFIEALLVAVLAALLAGLYPAWRMGRMLTSEALRSE